MQHIAPGVVVNVTIKSKKKDWVDRLLALGKFLKSVSKEDETITIYAYEDDVIGGLRIAEVDFLVGNGGGSYMRSDEESRKVIFHCEEFLATYGIKPTRPEGWESCLNEHGETRCNILRAMDMFIEADAEYVRQLEGEPLITGTVSENTRYDLSVEVEPANTSDDVEQLPVFKLADTIGNFYCRTIG